MTVPYIAEPEIDRTRPLQPADKPQNVKFIAGDVTDETVVSVIISWMPRLNILIHGRRICHLASEVVADICGTVLPVYGNA